MDNGMKVVQLGYKTSSKFNKKKAESKTVKEYVMVCEGRHGQKMTYKQPEPLTGYTTGDILEFSVSNNQTTIDEFRKAEEELAQKKAAEKEKIKAEKKAGIKHKRE